MIKKLTKEEFVELALEYQARRRARKKRAERDCEAVKGMRIRKAIILRHLSKRR